VTFASGSSDWLHAAEESSGGIKEVQNGDTQRSIFNAMVGGEI
jgi:hypothetical protein